MPVCWLCLMSEQKEGHHSHPVCYTLAGSVRSELFVFYCFLCDAFCHADLLQVNYTLKVMRAS